MKYFEKTYWNFVVETNKGIVALGFCNLWIVLGFGVGRNREKGIS
jgi:hypothetical protein